MSEAIVATRYAEALSQLSEEKNSRDTFAEEPHVIRDVCTSDQKLFTFLEHPRINTDQNEEFLNEIFHGLQPNIVHTMIILAQRDRIEITPSMIDHYIQLLNDAKGIAEATVYSVRPLSNPERSALVKNLAKRLNKSTINLQNIVDTSVLGGLKIRVGNTIFDGSLSGKLKRIERNIVTANK